MGAISTIRAEFLELATISNKNDNLRHQLNLPDNYDKLTPSGKIKAIAALGPSVPGLTDYLDTQAMTNVLRGVHGSARSVASGITSYVKFFSAIHTNPFPAIPITIRRWSATFNCGETFAFTSIK